MLLVRSLKEETIELSNEFKLKIMLVVESKIRFSSFYPESEIFLSAIYSELQDQRTSFLPLHHLKSRENFS